MLALGLQNFSIEEVYCLTITMKKHRSENIRSMEEDQAILGELLAL